jgi:hypothetical protein
LFAVPFLRPFRWPWLLRTSLIPLIPFFIVLDGDSFGHASPQRRRAPGVIHKVRPRGLVRFEGADNPLGPSTRSRDRAARHIPAECSRVHGYVQSAERAEAEAANYNFGLRNPHRPPVEGARPYGTVLRRPSRAA